PLLLALPAAAAVGGGDPRRLLAGDRRADGVPGAEHGGARRDGGLRRLPARHAGAATAGLAGGVELSRRLRPAGAVADVLVRAVAGQQRRPGAAPEQRPDAQRQVARQDLPGREVGGGEGRQPGGGEAAVPGGTEPLADGEGAGDVRSDDEGGGVRGR